MSSKIFILKNKEVWLSAIIITVIVMFFNANFLASYFSHPKGKEFSGIIGVSTIDYSVYFSMIEQVKQGSVLVKNLYSTENLTGGMFHPLWLFLGEIARWFNWDSVSVYHWSKIVFGFMFLWFLYYLLRQFIQGRVWRLLALAGFGFLAGWGRWLSILTINYFQGNEVVRLLFGTDMWHNEGFVFLTLTHSPLFIITQLFLILAWWWVIAGKKNNRLAAAVILFILGLMHPYDILIFWSVLMVYLVLEWLRGKNIFRIIFSFIPSFLASLVLVGYYAFLIVFDGNFSGWFNQNVTLSPSFYATLVGYGWLWLFSGYALWCLFKELSKLDKKFIFLLAWYITLPFLMFAPINFSRRMIQTFGVVIIIMSVLGLQFWWKKTGRKFAQRHFILTALIGSLLIIMTIITPLYQGIENLAIVSRGVGPGFIFKDQIELAGKLKDLPSTAVVFAPYFISHIIPGRSGRFVYFGHPHQTVNFRIKHKLASLFFSTKWMKWKEKFLKNNKIDYLVWPKEKPQDFSKSWPVWFENGSFVVYKISNK